MTNIANEQFCSIPTQNVNLTPELSSFVKEQVDSGDFNNASEVHRAALLAMRKSEEERLARLGFLRDKIERGGKDIEEGRYSEINDQSDLRELIDQCGQEALLKSRAPK